MSRRRHPNADVKHLYRFRLYMACLGSACFLSGAFALFPHYAPRALKPALPLPVIQVEDVPATEQRLRPVLSRPVVPVAVDDEDAPEDATIEVTELQLDRLVVDLRLPRRAPGAGLALPEEEEALELWQVEEEPQLIRQVALDYPQVARRAGVQGTVFINLLVGSNGQVRQAKVVRGLEVFHGSALKAARQFVFKPARQNDRAVPVWVTVPIEFRLYDGEGH